MLNNKGQVLVFFIFLIPLILLVLILVIDIGNVTYQKVALDNICNIALDEIDKGEDKVKEIIRLNDNSIKNIEINNNQIILKKKVEGFFSNVIDMKFFNIESVCYKERNN